MQEYLCNDLASILAPILLLLTLVNAAMMLTAYKAENVSGEEKGQEEPDKLMCAIFQCVHAWQAERLIARQQKDIQRLSSRVDELCKWLGQLHSMVHTNEHVAERLLSLSTLQRRTIDMLRHRLRRSEHILHGFVEREKEKEEQRKEKAKREKRKAGIWEVSGRRLRRVGREEELRGGRDQEGREEEVGERGFQLVGDNSEDFGNFAAQAMEESQILQRDAFYPAQSVSPLPFFDDVYDPHRAKAEQSRNRGGFGWPGGSREDEAPRRCVLPEPFIWAARGGKFRSPATRIREIRVQRRGQ